MSSLWAPGFLFNIPESYNRGGEQHKEDHKKRPTLPERLCWGLLDLAQILLSLTH